MAKAKYTESFGHLYKHGPVFKIHYLLRTNLCSIQRDAENIGVGFSEMPDLPDSRTNRRTKRLKLHLEQLVFLRSVCSLHRRGIVRAKRLQIAHTACAVIPTSFPKIDVHRG